MELSDIKAIGEGVISSEAFALQILRDNFPDGFAEAVKYISEELKGDVIVTGMGKGGYIAHRLAATLSSTGIRSIYLHPAEASHGDMGVITEDDCIIMISNSGESSELFNIIDYAKRFGVKIIAICSVPESTLGRAADIIVPIPAVAEDCIIGKAPTASIVLISAMANAFVVALEQLSGLTSDRYHNWHPHGALGKSLLKVDKIMHVGGDVPLLPLAASMDDVFECMSRPVRFGCVAAVDSDGRFAGVLTDGDLRRLLRNRVEFMDKKLGDVMNSSPISIQEGTLATEATRLMNERKIQVLFVIDAARRPAGIISFHDLMRAGII
ncbi:MAG: KpsF/GutQ family sugar-phosphate isomerase [Rickettsiales bacterium]|jgi:arabinose-5-phosphate isomerase|nr:KpsF/GutQ family sugar-phosphate isomerase [Rickettsiales bacterium]